MAVNVPWNSSVSSDWNDADNCAWGNLELESNGEFQGYGTVLFHLRPTPAGTVVPDAEITTVLFGEISIVADLAELRLFASLTADRPADRQVIPRARDFLARDVCANVRSRGSDPRRFRIRSCRDRDAYRRRITH